MRNQRWLPKNQFHDNKKQRTRTDVGRPDHLDAPSRKPLSRPLRSYLESQYLLIVLRAANIPLHALNTAAHARYALALLCTVKKRHSHRPSPAFDSLWFASSDNQDSNYDSKTTTTDDASGVGLGMPGEDGARAKAPRAVARFRPKDKRQSGREKR